MATMDLAKIVLDSAGDFSIITGNSIQFKLDKTPAVSVNTILPSINVIRNKHIFLPGANLFISSNTFNLKTSIRKLIEKIKPAKRSWQARLGSHMDNIYKKSMDNKISLSAYPIDMVRVKVTRDPRTLDLISRTVISNEVIPIYFEEAFTNLPLRRLEYEKLRR